MREFNKKRTTDLFKSMCHPKVVKYRTSLLYKKRKTKEYPVMQALREALNSTMLKRKPSLEQYHRLYRICGYLMIVSALYLGQSPWINEKRASVEVAKKLAYDCPNLIKRVEAFLDE